MSESERQRRARPRNSNQFQGRRRRLGPRRRGGEILGSFLATQQPVIALDFDDRDLPDDATAGEPTQDRRDLTAPA